MKICFVAHFAYGALSGGKGGHTGGVERQTSLMAKWFAKKGHDVSFLTWDEGQKKKITNLNGIRNIKICKRNHGVPGIRFFTPRWTGLVKAMRLADADLYYQNCAEYVTGQVALWSKIHHKKFIFSVPSDPDCDAALPKMSSFREKVLYRYGLKNADCIIVQTDRQQGMLKNNFKLESIVLPMPCPGLSNRDYAKITPTDNDIPRILWVGRVSKEKRLEVFIDTAKKMPHYEFDIVGGPYKDIQYGNSLLEQASKIKNITVHGIVEREKMDHFYKNASLLCCTSLYEGFPNTFLEAWNFGVPVISTVDPDNVISHFKLGYPISDISGIKQKIDQILSNRQLRNEYSEHARSYFASKHLADNAMLKFHDVFSQTLG
jgi:glycosyltransferase involved in cell wall biosynthesis